MTIRSLGLGAALVAPCWGIVFGACSDGSSAGPSGGNAGAAGAASFAGSGGVGGLVGGQGGATTGLLIDDFEDGDEYGRLGGAWFVYTDGENGGASRVTRGLDGDKAVVDGEGYQSRYGFALEYELEQADYEWDPYVGFGINLGTAEQPFDITPYDTLTYWYRGDAHFVRVEMVSVEDYDFHLLLVPASSEWERAVVPLSALAQGGWGAPLQFDPTDLRVITFHLTGPSGQTGTLEVDDLSAVQDAEATPQDMELKEPAPPAPVVLESLTIDNPLQDRALRTLSKGNSLPDWPDAERSDGFVTDEETVRQLAAAGFESLRLPLDFDQYVEEVTGSGDALDVVLYDDLFDILDAFDTWTSEHGLSLTIDYHQYDRSLDLNDPDSVAVVVKLWGLVAEHFADNPREDLFFELLNEPELSVTEDSPPTQEIWTALAEELISTIRESDSSHTIIFGDYQWYGIDALTQREPFADENVIYAFHLYDPYLFTHQGASWSDLGEVHGIPYPYAPDRWAESYNELGFDRSMSSWILALAQDYYREGNRSAIYNRAAAAKEWAVRHNVAVICNEFGAYDGVSSHEDRAEYLTDVVGILEELEIPWQHWFSLMDDTGAIHPDYVTALGLEE